MNSDEIERIVRRHVPDFDGVFGADRLPARPHLLVSNTDPSHRPGEHWVAMYVDGRGEHGEYFDSFGRPPPARFRRYMDRHCRHWTFNDRQLQSVVTPLCGHYCVFFVVARSRGVDLRKIANCFTDDTGYNDSLIHRFVCGRRGR